MGFSLMTNGPLSHTFKKTDRLNKLDQAVMPLAYTWGLYLTWLWDCGCAHFMQTNARTVSLSMPCLFHSNSFQFNPKNQATIQYYCLKYDDDDHHQVLLLLVEHRASMKSFQALQSPAIPLTSFHDLVLLFHSLLPFATFSSAYFFFYIPEAYSINVLTFKNPILIFHFMPKGSPLLSSRLLFISVSLITEFKVCRLLAYSARSQSWGDHLSL